MGALPVNGPADWVDRFEPTRSIFCDDGAC